jgi:hypothetical protein
MTTKMKIKKVKCEIEEITLYNYETSEGESLNEPIAVASTMAICSRCGHETESFGTEKDSIKRCLALMREECPREETQLLPEG